jgi:ElaB/YqjD/DUF883 family membrane-anchored ribosome-binding protein
VFSSSRSPHYSGKENSMSRMSQSEAGGQMKETAQQVQQDLRDLGGQVRDVAEEKYQHLRDQASQYYQQGRQRAQEWEQGLEQYVQEKPIQSLLIAAGVGMLLGILWRRS